MKPPDQPLLEARGLRKLYRSGGRFGGSRASLVACDDVFLMLMTGETLAVVGESGCGKSSLGRCLLRLTDIDAGDLFFDGKGITDWSQRLLRPLRSEMQMIFQNPTASLNPRCRIGDLLAEAFRASGGLNRSERDDRVAAALRRVDLLPEFAGRYPHECSGGQKQRVAIARALATQPRLVVADEPVSALDVSIQAQIVNLLLDLRDQMGLSLVFISHDLAVVRQIASRVAVMYLGRIVEMGDGEAIFSAPRHPYSATLRASVLEPGIEMRAPAIIGDLPNPADPPQGCGFHPRCPVAQPICRVESPSLSALGPGRAVACHFPLAG